MVGVRDRPEIRPGVDLRFLTRSERDERLEYCFAMIDDLRERASDFPVRESALMWEDEIDDGGELLPV